MFCAPLPAEKNPAAEFLASLWRQWGPGVGGWGGAAAQRPAVWRSENATLSRLLHIAPAQHVLDSTTSRFLSQYELNLDFLSTQQERAAGDIGDTSFQAEDRQSVKVYAKEL